ncbi:hypothetical protein H5T88_00305 [bacterium]|nr:hypothetical protein [bacterium]
MQYRYLSITYFGKNTVIPILCLLPTFSFLDNPMRESKPNIGAERERASKIMKIGVVCGYFKSN